MRLILAISLSVSWFSSAAFACSCMSSGGCPGLGGQAGPLFLGTVLSVTDVPAAADSFLSGLRARIRVDEPFGGLAPDAREVDVYTGRGGGDCGIEFKAGEVYLIDASVGKEGTMYAGICSSTRRLDAAGVLLRVLRQRRDGKPVPSLIGQAARQDRNFDGLLETLAIQPLANLLVRVKVDQRLYDARADAEGIFAFYNLPSGKYEFAPELPPGTTLSWFIDSDKPQTPFELHAGACQVRDMEVFSSGSIQGRILDASGKPLPSAFAYIVPVSEKVLPKQNKLYWEYQDKDKEGSFKFVHIPPGDYWIVVNPEDSLDPKFPYRRTFFPGVHDQASASPITIRGGEQIKDIDIRLEQQFAPRHLTARVTWSDGRLIRDFVFVTAKPTSNPAAMSDTKQPNLKASVIELSVLPDEPYEVEAELTCRYADARILSGPGAKLVSNKIYLAPGDNQKELRLTIPAISCPNLPGKTTLTDR
jgi:hypothetical protein